MLDEKAHFDADMPSVDFGSLNEHVLQLLSTGDREGLARLLAGHHPSELATLLEQIPMPELAVETFRAIPDEISGEVMASVAEGLRDDLLRELSGVEIASVVTDTPPDDAVDIIEDLSERERAEVLREVPAEQRAEIEQLMVYAPDTAGGLMSPRFTTVREDMTAREAIEEIRRVADSTTETIYYVYVVDAGGVLKGVLSLRELLLTPSSRRVSEVMTTPVRSIEAHEDQEEAAHLFSEYDLLALPVVDEGFRIIGVITVDDILDVREEEQTEDVQKMVGAGGDERVDSPVWFSARRRLPWLAVNLVAAYGAALVVASLEEAIRLSSAVALFMPVVAGVAGNTGAQSLAVVFRSVIMEEGGSRLVGRILWRSAILGFLNSLVVSVLSAFMAFGLMTMAKETSLQERMQIAQVIGVAMVISMTFASAVGAGIPLLMRRLGWDPARNANILLTALTDMTGLGIYLGLVILWLAK